VTSLRGKRVIDLKIDDGSSGDVFVALDGTPYPLRLAYGRGAAQHVDFDQFGAKVTLTAPPASKVVAVPAS
jgi:predicted heme/steroid binding protein